MPRSKEDFYEVSLKRRKTILDEALKLFSSFGYDAVTVDDITKASRCSHGLFYHYFSSKQDILDCLMKEIGQKWNQEIQQLDYSASPLSVIKQITDYLLSYIYDDTKNYVLYLLLTLRLQKTLPAFKKPRKKPITLIDHLIENFQRGQKEGIFIEGDAYDYIRIYLASFQGLSYIKMHVDKKKFRPINENALINVFLKKEDNKCLN